ncbi:MAG: DNA-3-methyladenine glycosylase I, partial [Malacoplasma sp.]|nr:DNA-3-methyladenine glycosylase I [Malacoplasma sp.]
TTENELSKKIAKELKKFGFKFIGSVTIFSYLQAIGIYNDHEKDCFLNENKKMK